MNLQETIIRILREETKVPIALRRRIDFSVMDRVFEESLDIMSTRYVKHADKWNAMTAKKFKIAVVSDMMQYLQNIMYTQYMNEKVFEEMWVFLMDYYSPQMEEEYYKISGESKQEQNESEITEKCWKGYTQKGMKTMFGKKYPNCVKKTNK